MESLVDVEATSASQASSGICKRNPWDKHDCGYHAQMILDADQLVSFAWQRGHPEPTEQDKADFANVLDKIRRTRRPALGDEVISLTYGETLLTITDLKESTCQLTYNVGHYPTVWSKRARISDLVPATKVNLRRLEQIKELRKQLAPIQDKIKKIREELVEEKYA